MIELLYYNKSLYKFILYYIFNKFIKCHNVAKQQFLTGQLWFNVTFNGNAQCLKKALYSGIPNAIGVLLKRLHLKAYKLYIVRDVFLTLAIL
jgi:hypothetical protein